MTPEEQLALIRSKLAELLGLAEGAGDEEFATALDKYISDAEAEESEGQKTAEQIAAEAAEKEKKAAVEMQNTVAAYEAKVKEFAAKVTGLEKEVAEFKAKEAVEARKCFEAEVDAVLDGAIKEGKLLPAERATQRVMLVNADRTAKIEFADDKGEKVQKTMFASLVESIKARPVQVVLNEVSKTVEPDAAKPAAAKTPDGIKRFADAAAELDPKSIKIDQRTRELMASDKLTYGDAMRRAVKELRAA